MDKYLTWRNIIVNKPSGQIKNSDMRRVRADHQVRLAHTEEHWVALRFGEIQELFHCALINEKRDGYEMSSPQLPKEAQQTCGVRIWTLLGSTV